MPYSIPLKEIQKVKVPQNVFTLPKKYEHLDIKFEPIPIWIEFDKIRSLDDDRNIGRTQPHTQQEIQQLANSFKQGVVVSEELPCVSRNFDKEYQKFDFDQQYGYGRVDALEESGQKGHWFNIVEGDEYNLGWLKVLENLDFLPKFTQGEKLIIYHCCNLIAKGKLLNTEADILSEITKKLPMINKTSLGRISKVIFETKDTPLRYQTWGPVKIKKWLKQDAGMKFELNGKFDVKRDRYGFANKNILDPFHQSIMKFAETGKGSYAILHVNPPNGQGGLEKLRSNKIKEFNKYSKNYKKTFKVKSIPLEILGFMPQDNKNEDKRYLVTIKGNPISRYRLHLPIKHTSMDGKVSFTALPPLG